MNFDHPHAETCPCAECATPPRCCYPGRPCPGHELDALRAEREAWRRATGFDDPEALAVYLSRQTVRESDDVIGAMLREAQDDADALRQQIDLALGGVPGGGLVRRAQVAAETYHAAHPVDRRDAATRVDEAAALAAVTARVNADCLAAESALARVNATCDRADREALYRPAEANGIRLTTAAIRAALKGE